MSYDVTESADVYSAKRVRLVTNARFEPLVSAFEQVVPALSESDALARLAEDRDWSTFTRGLQWESRSGFVRVRSSRPGELLRHAGSPTPSILWHIVNHSIAARLFRHDPATMLYSPLRVEAHAVSEGGTVLGFEVPSEQLRGFDINKITQAGAELDRALGDLLEELGLPRPAALRR